MISYRIMLKFFKLRGVEDGAQPAPSTQAPLASIIPAAKVSEETQLDLLAALSQANGLSAVQHGARLAVMGELLASVLTHLPDTKRAEIAKSFRGRVEFFMSLSDDTPLPEKYHSALLNEINRYLKALS